MIDLPVDEDFLVVDVQGIQNPYHPERGIARYVREQSRALLEHWGKAIDCFLASAKLGLVDGLEPLIASGSLEWNYPNGPEGRDLDSKPFVYYATSIFEIGMSIDDVWPPYVRRADVLTAITVYDLIPLVYPDQYLHDRAFRHRYRARLGLIQNADLVLAISEATAEDVVRLLDVPPDRVVNIGTGVAGIWRPAQAEEDPAGSVRRAFPEIRPGYVFYTGGIDFRKNMERLLEAYAMLPHPLRHKHQLVITCSMDRGGELALRDLIEVLDLEEDVVLTGYVPDEILLHLYQTAHLFMFPSLYEGFGLPLAEAIRAGAPALTADRASMREILPDSDFRFDPADSEAIAASMKRALTDDDYRGRAKEAGVSAVSSFTWEKVASRTLEACTDLWERRGPSSAQGQALVRQSTLTHGRPRIAWFSPMPPQPSGIADYSARLLEEIVNYVDVDVFVEGPLSEYELPSSEKVTLRRHESFALLDAAGAYDEVIYCMGNSEFHAYIYESLIRRTGVVLAHEVRFSGFYSWYANNRSSDGTFFGRMLVAQHPNVPTTLGERGWITVDEAERFGVYMVSEMLGKSKHFLVHSRYAADIARLNSNGFADRVAVVPFGIGEPIAKDGAHSSSHPLIVTIGIAAEVKRIETFVRSIPTVLKFTPEARFAIVGGFAPPEYEDKIEQLALSLGVLDRLSITGHVGRREYEWWMRRASCAVQLRATSNGETSAAIADCMRHGIPTIVTAIGSGREYPLGSVWPLPPETSPGFLGEAIANIVQDQDLASSLADAGIEFARSSTFGAAARSILERIDLLTSVPDLVS